MREIRTGRARASTQDGSAATFPIAGSDRTSRSFAPAVALGVLSAAASWFHIPALERARRMVSLTSSIGPEVVSSPAQVSARRIVSAIFSPSTARKAALGFITSFSAMSSRVKVRKFDRRAPCGLLRCIERRLKPRRIRSWREQVLGSRRRRFEPNPIPGYAKSARLLESASDRRPHSAAGP